MSSGAVGDVKWHVLMVDAGVAAESLVKAMFNFSQPVVPHCSPAASYSGGNR